jgi:serine/threonine-protein kinase
VVRVLAENDHSRVYLAQDLSGVRVALKELLYTRAPDARAIEALEREARTIAQLSHPRIPRFLESFREGTGAELRLFLAQEFIDGVSLADELRSKTFAAAELPALAAEVLAILRYLHGLSPRILHRDVKPANLVRRRDGALFLVDFGTAREIKVQGTVHGTMTGTLGYAPLEQMGGTLDATTDLYALGATLLHLLTRIPPDQLLGGFFELQIPAGIPCPPKLRRFIRRLVARRPSDRVQSVEAAERELSSPPFLLPSRRKRVMGAAFGAAALAGGLLLVFRPQLDDRNVAMATAAKPLLSSPQPVPPVPTPPAPVPSHQEFPLRARWRFNSENRSDRIKDQTDRYDLEIHGGIVSQPGPSGDAWQLGSFARMRASVGSLSTGTVSFWLRHDLANGLRNPESVLATGAFDLVLTAEESLTLSAGKPQNEVRSHPLKPATFHHVAVTWTEAEATLYLDGEIAGTGPRRTTLASIQHIELGPGRISVADLMVRPVPAPQDAIAAEAAAGKPLPIEAGSGSERDGKVLYEDDFAVGVAGLVTNDLPMEWASIGRDPDGRKFLEMAGSGSSPREDLCARVNIEVPDAAILEYEWRAGAAGSGPFTIGVGVQTDGEKGPLPPVWSMRMNADSTAAGGVGLPPAAWSAVRMDVTERIRQTYQTSLKRIRGICFTGTGSSFVAQFARMRVTRAAK